MNITTEPKRPKQDPPPYHPGGDCNCFQKFRRIVRHYLGYGYCGFCGRLTKGKTGTR
jgi:hypothetical protein